MREAARDQSRIEASSMEAYHALLGRIEHIGLRMENRDEAEPVTRGVGGLPRSDHQVVEWTLR